MYLMAVLQANLAVLQAYLAGQMRISAIPYYPVSVWTYPDTTQVATVVKRVLHLRSYVVLSYCGPVVVRAYVNA